jgi:inner membrane protein
LILSANAPDIDIVSAFFGSDAALSFRRGWTHGPVAVLGLPLLVTALLMAWDRSIRPRSILALCYIGCLTHPLLDWLNTYGVRLLMPFDARWFYGDALFIVDPWIWLVLGGALFVGSKRGRFPWGWTILGCATSLVLLKAGAMVPPTARALWFLALLAIFALRWAVPRVRPSAVATVALGLSLAYIGAMVALSAAGSIRVRRELARDGTPIERLMVAPEPANPLAWYVVADVGDRYVLGSLTWYGRAAFALGVQPIPKPTPSAVLDQARAEPSVHGTLPWMRFPYAEIEETPGGWTVYFLDARYVRGRRPGFGTATVEILRRR